MSRSQGKSLGRHQAPAMDALVASVRRVDPGANVEDLLDAARQIRTRQQSCLWAHTEGFLEPFKAPERGNPALLDRLSRLVLDRILRRRGSSRDSGPLSWVPCTVFGRTSDRTEPASDVCRRVLCRIRHGAFRLGRSALARPCRHSNGEPGLRSRGSASHRRPSCQMSIRLRSHHHRRLECEESRC